MQLIIRCLIFVLISISSHSYAQVKGDGYEFQLNKSTITIMFVNGILNTVTQTADSSDTLMTSLYRLGLEKDKYNHTYYYNPTDGKISDGEELSLQAKISDKFYSQNKQDYYLKLGNYYNQTSSAGSDATLNRVISTSMGLKNRIINVLNYSTGIIIIPHSQGNFYMESAYAMLVADGRTDLINKIRVVGAASVAPTTPNDRYITSTTDKAIEAQKTLAIKQLTPLGSPLPSNQTPCIGDTCGDAIDWYTIDLTGHGFSEVYLNFGITNASNISFPNVIYDLVNKSIIELSNSIITNFPIITATVGSATTFNIVGTNLPKTEALAVTLIGSGNTCPSFTYGTKSATLHTFSCTFTQSGTYGFNIFTNTGLKLGSYNVSATSGVNIVSSFSEDFTTINPDKTIGGANNGVWTYRTLNQSGGCSSASISTITATPGIINFGNCNAIETSSRVNFTGGKYVIEARFAGTGGSRNSYIQLTDAANGWPLTANTNYINIGDTNYNGAAQGVYVGGGGVFSIDKRGLMPSTSAFKEFRITITANQVQIQRGDSLANLTESSTVALPASVEGKQFYLMIGDAVTPWTGATFNWIRVNTF